MRIQYANLLLFALVIPFGGTIVRGQTTAQPGKQLKATRVDWEAGFSEHVRTARSANFATGLAVRPSLVSQSFLSTSKISVSTSLEAADTMDAEVWLAEASGANPQRLTVEHGCTVHTLQGSPTGTRLAYIAEPFPPTPQSHAARLIVVDVANGQKTTIAERGAATPQWMPDGQTLLFSQWNGLKAKWELHRAQNLNGVARTELASTLAFNQPCVCSQDGTHVAGLVNEKVGSPAAISNVRLVVEQLTTRQSIEYSFTQPITSEEIHWSPTGEWIYVAGRPLISIARPLLSFLFQPSTGKMLTLDSLVPKVKDEHGNQDVEITSAGWFPGEGNRLLFCILPANYNCVRLPVPRNTPLPQRHWAMYDVATSSMKEVIGLNALQQDGPISWTPDGQSVMIGAHEYRLDTLP